MSADLSDTAEAASSCAAVAELLPAIDHAELLPDAAGAHLRQCLRCQAEAASYRRMRRCLASLAQYPAAVVGESGLDFATGPVPGSLRRPRELAARSRDRLSGALAARSSIRIGAALADRTTAAAAGAAAALAAAAGGVAIAAATRRALRDRYRLGAC